MLGDPAVIERSEEPYVAIKALVTMDTIGSVLPGLHPEVRNWLRERDTTPAGPPFFKFDVIDMERQLEVEVGWPVGAEMKGDDPVLAGVLPAGRYASVLYTGHPDGLLDATRDLLEWAAGLGLEFDVTRTPEGDRWAARLEIYRDDDEPDMSKWEIELAFKLAGD
jgi:effector-binding domain-containing protein